MRTLLAVLMFPSLFIIVGSAEAQPLVFHPRDMMLCLGKTGSTGGSASDHDLEVDIGQVSNFLNAAPGSVTPISQYGAPEIGLFDSLDGISWSVGAYVTAGDGGDPTYPAGTLWAVAPRMDPSVQTQPWLRKSPSNQSLTGNKMGSIAYGAAQYSSFIPADPIKNNATSVWVPTSDGRAYSAFIGPNGNYGTFQGTVENTTALNFTSSPGAVSRSDLYELRPSTTGGPGTFVGYFEFRPNGTTVFVKVGGTSPPPPVQVSITVIGGGVGSIPSPGTNTISFLSTTGATYTLYFTNSTGLTTPATNWPALTGTITGDGTIKSFIDVITTNVSNRFYRVGAR